MEQVEQNGSAALRHSLAKLPSHLQHLRVPDGRELSEVDAAELRRVMINLDVPGVSPSDGREALAECWSRHLEQIGKHAAERAIADYLRASR
jgi:hypothetical protein